MRAKIEPASAENQQADWNFRLNKPIFRLIRFDPRATLRFMRFDHSNATLWLF